MNASVRRLEILLLLCSSTTKSAENKQVAQLSKRDGAAGWVSYGQKKWKTGIGRQYVTDIIGLSSSTVT